jgi:hypothetical protein
MEHMHDKKQKPPPPTEEVLNPNPQPPTRDANTEIGNDIKTLTNLIGYLRGTREMACRSIFHLWEANVSLSEVEFSLWRLSFLRLGIFLHRG